MFVSFRARRNTIVFFYFVNCYTRNSSLVILKSKNLPGLFFFLIDARSCEKTAILKVDRLSELAAGRVGAFLGGS